MKKKGCCFGRARNLADGSVVYSRKGVEPPPDLEGFIRDPNNHWKFIPNWNACDFRNQTQYVKQCGAVGVFTICKHTNKQVSFNDCSTCKLPKTK